MRIAVMAAGAVGGYFGGRMAAAGHDVAFIARGAHGDAIRRDGLTIESALGDLHLKDVNVTDDPTQVGPVDVVLFAVKLWDTETAGEQTCPLLGRESRVITLQNGVDSVERLAPILGEEAVIAGTTYVVALAGKSADRPRRLSRRPIFSAFSHLVSQNDKVIKGLPNLLPP
jgi:2-dehydropantoate 2-reductase